MISHFAGPLDPVVVTPFSFPGRAESGAPASGNWGTVSRACFYPFPLRSAFQVAKAFWCNGATVGTDSVDLGIYQMTDLATGRLDLLRSTGLVLSAGTANAVQETSVFRVAATALTASGDSSDLTDYITASLTLKAGRLYLLAFANTAANAAVISGISGGGTWTSRSSVQYNGTGNRVSIWSCVPTADYTGTITVSFGATQTAARWALTEMSGVDTSSNDGIVQQATGTGSSTTPLATLGAFASANNATFGALSNATDSTTTPGTGFFELSDVTSGSAPWLQTQWRVDNDTTVDGTITSAPWGVCAVEVKVDPSPLIIPSSNAGQPVTVYMGMTVSGTTATIVRLGNGSTSAPARANGVLTAINAFWLPSTITPTPAAGTTMVTPLAGFSRRSLLG